MPDIFKTLIVTDAIVADVRALADAYPPGPPTGLTVALSPTGEAPATHWGASGNMADEFVSLWDLDATGFAAGAASLLGVTLTQAKAQEILDGSHMSSTSVWVVLDSMELQMVVEEEQG